VDKFTAPQLRAVLGLLGLQQGREDDPDWSDVRWLAGCLLAYAELAVHLEENGEEETSIRAYLDVLLMMAGDASSAGAMWSALMADRLYRTSEHMGMLHTGDAGGRAHADVAMPALITAANVLSLINQQISHADVRDGVNAARYNVRATTENLAALVAFVRGQGVQIPDDIVDPETVMGPPTD
jgi:hypothetical protein